MATTNSIEMSPSNSREGLQKQKEAFKKQEQDAYKMLFAMVNAQNPLDPSSAMDPTKMMQMQQSIQAIQNQFFASEQSLYAQQTMQELIKSQSLSLTGKAIRVEGNEFSLTEKGGTFAYEINKENVSATEILIFDEKNEKVFQAKGKTDKGNHIFTWDGIDLENKKLNPGIYKVMIRSYAGNNQPSYAKTYIYAPIFETERNGDETNFIIQNAHKEYIKVKYDPNQEIAIATIA